MQEMKGHRQLVRRSVANVDLPEVWNILTNSSLLPKWAPQVRHVEKFEITGEAVGAVRQCQVELAGRPGTIVEKCVDIEPLRHIAYVVEHDSFGMTEMFAEYGFRISLQAGSPSSTRVQMETFYTPRNGLYSILNAVIMRRRFRRVVDELLAGLVTLAEESSRVRKRERSAR